MALCKALGKALSKRLIHVEDDEVTNAGFLTARQSFFPNLLVTSLFLLWGFVYGLLDVLTFHCKTLFHLSYAQSAGLSAAFFAAYFLCPLSISGSILRRQGFRDTFHWGLTVLVLGCLLVWLSIKRSFLGFCFAMFVVGCGTATLETAANPFLAICGPPRYSEVRLNFARYSQGVGSCVASVVAYHFVFPSTLDGTKSLENVQWMYISVACFAVLLAVVFMFASIPEITNADMAAQETNIQGNPGPLRNQHNLFFAVWGQFSYVGAQVAVSTYFIPFCREAGRTKLDSVALLGIGQSLFAANSCLVGGLMMTPAVRPRLVLPACLGGTIIFSMAAMWTTGNASIALLLVVVCCESACFATIFTMGLRGLGHHTKVGGSMLVAANSGGMIYPPMMGAVADTWGLHSAVSIPLMGYVLAFTYATYADTCKRELMDSHRSSDIGIVQDDEEVELEEQPQAEGVAQQTQTREQE